MKHVLVDARGKELLERIGKFRVPRRTHFSVMDFIGEKRVHGVKVDEHGTYTGEFFSVQEQLSEDHAPEGTKIRMYRQLRPALVQETFQALGKKELLLYQFYESILHIGAKRDKYALTQGQRVVAYVRGQNNVLFSVYAFWVAHQNKWVIDLVVMNNINPHYDNAIFLC